MNTTNKSQIKRKIVNQQDAVGLKITLAIMLLILPLIVSYRLSYTVTKLD